MKIIASGAQAEARQSPLFGQSQIPNAESRRLIAGVDEAGRGPLAGPVAVAAVVFDPSKPRINGLDDSKQLSAQRREQLYARIVERALAWSVVLIDSEEIDRINIYQATMLGMRRAVEGVAHVAGFARIDGNRVPKGLPCPAEALIGGDALDRAIMAASIVAKVTRDRLMHEPARPAPGIPVRPAQGLCHAGASGRAAQPRTLPAAPPQLRPGAACVGHRGDAVAVDVPCAAPADDLLLAD